MLITNFKKYLAEFQIFDNISEIAADCDIPIFLVGGYVRDLILKRTSKDIDIVVVGDGIKFAREFEKSIKTKSKLSIFKNFGTANLKFKNFEIEFVGARKESYRRDTRNPIVEAGTLEDDLNRRDFTINAIAISLNKDTYGTLIDLFDGYNDIENGIIQTPLDPDRTFSDDPLRMMRAVRFATQLSFELTDITFNSIKKNIQRISIISQERITDELNKILLSPKPSLGFDLLFKTGLLNFFLPEVAELKGTETVDNKSHKDNFYHTIKVLDKVAEVSDNLWLRWVALLHDIGKPKTKKFDPSLGWTFHGHEVVGFKIISRIFKRLKLPLNEKMQYVQRLVALHLRPVSLTKNDISDSAIRRLIVDAGNDIEDLLILCKADITSKNPDRVNKFINRFDMVQEKIRMVEEKDKLRNWKNPISGDIIIEEFNIAPSKEVGIIKEEIKEAILDGKINNNFEDAFNYMIKIGAKLGLKQNKK